ncbi:MAG: EAL domain-containing protein [Rhodospirillales bacterium]|nr:EAL domain-containing protein [Rhodospirillales bacterium]
MKRRTRRLLIFGFGGSFLAIVPIVVGLGWTYLATVEQAQERIDVLARQVADNVHDVLKTAVEALTDVSQVAQQGCTDALILAMRTKAAALYAMRDIGYVTSDGFLTCNSYGRLDPPRAVGSPRTIEPDGSDFVITPPVATVFTPGKSIIISQRLPNGDFVNILVPPEVLLSPLRPGALGTGGSVEVTMQDLPLAVLGRPSRAHEQLFRAEEDSGIFGVQIAIAADRVSALAEWRRLAAINGVIGGAVGFVIILVAVRLAIRRPSMGDELREALDQQEFIVHYQPIIDLHANRCAGAEALIRWRHPKRGILPPDVFIALAEETGVIVPMTRWLMRRVGEEIGELLRADDGFHVAINLAPVHFLDLDVVADAKAAAEETDIRPRQMLFEITERGLVDDTFCREVIEGLAELGSRVAIDDFGTGYSNLAYIGMFRLDFLKIDKAFVKTIGSDAASAGLAQVIVDMASALGLKVIAEGVETRDQMAFLRDRGVGLAQGWYFSRPLPAVDLVGYVQKFR